MAEDFREAILSRMLAVMNAIPGESEVARNQLLNDDGSPHRLVLIDGDEMLAEDGTGLSNRPKLSQRVMKMYPLAVAGSAAKTKDVGSDLSTRRGKIISAIENDDVLAALTVKGKGGRYVGIESALAMGALVLGQSALKFEFTYLLRPDQF